MKPVTQKHAFGCGAACVAFIVKKSYEKVVSLLEESKAISQGYHCKDLVICLFKFNFSYSCKYLKPKLKRRIYNEGVIVFIKRSRKYPAGHYLTRHKGLWIDPWINWNIDNNIIHARSGFRKRLPGKPIYALFPKES